MIKSQTGATFASVSWGTANMARYYPFKLPWPYEVKRVFWGNGTANGNMDFGIYSIDGERIYSTGSTAQSGAGTSTLQYVTPGTSFTLAAGSYIFGINNDGTTNRGWGLTTIVNSVKMGGVYQQALGAVTLPASATFASAAAGMLALCGITRTSTGF